MTQADIHSHILPGADDGAGDMTEALDMLALAAADGTEVIAATPHDAYVNRAFVIAGVAALNDAAERAGIGISVVPGSEIRLDANLVDRYRSQTLTTLNNTSYVLLELPAFGGWPPFLRSAIYDLQVAGLQPILAHAERYPEVQRAPEILLDLIATDVIIQVNADSLTSRSDIPRRRTAELLIQTRAAHVLASDAHGTRSRTPVLASAYVRTQDLASPDYATWMRAASFAIVRGEPLVLPTPDLDRLVQSSRQQGHVRRWLTRRRFTSR